MLSDDRLEKRELLYRELQIEVSSYHSSYQMHKRANEFISELPHFPRDGDSPEDQQQTQSKRVQLDAWMTHHLDTEDSQDVLVPYQRQAPINHLYKTLPITSISHIPQIALEYPNSLLCRHSGIILKIHLLLGNHEDFPPTTLLPSDGAQKNC